ncbi:MAG: hypothetical protein N3B16_08400 [Candidatus Aminicenantes bacterium]|nr:hypothetical protein [Candidatus Aminicenantes bacterium]
MAPVFELETRPPLGQLINILFIGPIDHYLLLLIDESLILRVNELNILAGIVPNQKKWLILAINEYRNTADYLDKRINDASAFHTADVIFLNDNTLKYVFMATCANWNNMFSLAFGFSGQAPSYYNYFIYFT